MTYPRLKLIGFDSMGTRGMATVIDTGSLKIFIDPGVSLAPYRYGLPPHRLEIEKLNFFLEEIHEEINDSDIVIISHYHRDHYLYREGEEKYYRGKELFIKNPIRMINRSQRIRAYILLKKMNIENIARRIEYVDNKSFIIDKNIILSFSPPFPHGPENTKLGHVVVTLVNIDGFKIMHASDVQGPMSTNTLSYIIQNKPDLLIISGPPTYLEGYRMKREYIMQGFTNLAEITNSLKPGSTIILDHHLLRDKNYEEHISGLKKNATIRRISIVTAAEYMGLKNELLEAMRRELWMKNQ